MSSGMHEALRAVGSAGRSRRQAGLTLIELMVSLAVSSLLLIGSTTIYMQGRRTFSVNETVAKLQEDALFLLDVIEPQIRMASYFGFRARPERINGRAGPDDPVPMGLAVTDDCGVNWSIDLEHPVDGTNNSYDWDGCPAFGTGAEEDADTLVVRRVGEDADAAPQSGTLYIQSARFRDAELFKGPAVPGGFAAGNSASYRLITQGYYVSESSDTNPSRPSLRMKTLIGTAAGPAVIDQEVLPGVEDMQVQFGIDTDDIDSPDRGSANRYINADDPILDPMDPLFDPNAQIIAVRVWFRLRAEKLEPGFVDDARYAYADQDDGPFNDGYRRILIGKTIFLRNTRRTL